MLLLKLAIRPWKLSLYGQILSSAAVGALLLMTGMLFWLQQGLKPVTHKLMQEQIITAYLASAVDPADEGKVVDQIKVALGSQARRASIQMVPAAEFVTQLKKQYPDLGKEIEDLGADAASIVPRYVSIAGLLDGPVLDAVRAVPGVEAAESSRDRYKQALGAFRTLGWVARVLAVALVISLFAGLIHLARANASVHRDAISLMRLLGAGNARMRAPALLSGVSVGLCGGLIAASGWVFAGERFFKQVRGFSPLLRELPALQPGFALVLLGAGIAAGTIAGFFGGSAALAAASPGSAAASGARG